MYCVSAAIGLVSAAFDVRVRCAHWFCGLVPCGLHTFYEVIGATSELEVPTVVTDDVIQPARAVP